MSRNTALTVGLVLTVATVVLLVYAAKRVAYFFSFEQVTVPVATDPKNQPANGKRFRTITLSWDTVANAQTYNLYWSLRPGVTRHSGNRIAGVTPPYRFRRVADGQTYYFVVTAVTESGESSESDEIVYRAGP